MTSIGIIGIGNPLRCDDGIGIILLGNLVQKKKDFPPNIKFIDGGIGGMNLLHIFARFDIVVIIDAVKFGGNPGDFRLFNSKELRSKKFSVRTSVHETDVLKIINLSKELYECHNEIFIFAVQPKDTSFGQTLSPELEKEVESLTESLQNELVCLFNKLYKKPID